LQLGIYPRDILACQVVSRVPADSWESFSLFAQSSTDSISDRFSGFKKAQDNNTCGWTQWKLPKWWSCGVSVRGVRWVALSYISLTRDKLSSKDKPQDDIVRGVALVLLPFRESLSPLPKETLCCCRWEIASRDRLCGLSSGLETRRDARRRSSVPRSIDVSRGLDIPSRRDIGRCIITSFSGARCAQIPRIVSHGRTRARARVRECTHRHRSVAIVPHTTGVCATLDVCTRERRVIRLARLIFLFRAKWDPFSRICSRPGSRNKGHRFPDFPRNLGRLGRRCNVSVTEKSGNRKVRS